MLTDIVPFELTDMSKHKPLAVMRRNSMQRLFNILTVFVIPVIFRQNRGNNAIAIGCVQRHDWFVHRLTAYILRLLCVVLSKIRRNNLWSCDDIRIICFQNELIQTPGDSP